jgi:hypothetical protein
VHAGRRVVVGHDHGQHNGPVLAFGGHLGLAVHTRGGHATLVPQCGVLMSTLSSPSHTSPTFGSVVELSTLRQGAMRWECALGLSFGSRYQQ